MNRISSLMLVSQFLGDNQKKLSDLEESMYRVSSGKKYETPSDNAQATNQILKLRSSIQDIERYVDNVTNGKSWVGSADSVLSGTSDYMIHVSELANRGSNDSLVAQDRLAIAEELNGIFGEVLDTANTKVMDRYIFGGTKTDSAPFVSSENGNVDALGLPPGLNLESTDPFDDLYSLKTGNYSLFMRREGNSLVYWLRDVKGNRVQVDANGYDESHTGYNVLHDRGRVLLSKNSASGTDRFSAVVDTGRGLKVDLDNVDADFLKEGEIIKYDLKFEQGGSVNYQGNDGSINTQIGFHSFVPVNLSGEGLFKPMHRRIGAAVAIEDATEATPWSAIGVSTSATLKIEGVDRSGSSLGRAKAIGVDAVALDSLGNRVTNVQTELSSIIGANVSDQWVTRQPASTLSAATFKLYYDDDVHDSAAATEHTIRVSLHPYDSPEEVASEIQARIDEDPTLRGKVTVKTYGDTLAWEVVDSGAHSVSVETVSGSITLTAGTTIDTEEGIHVLSATVTLSIPKDAATALGIPEDGVLYDKGRENFYKVADKVEGTFMQGDRVSTSFTLTRSAAITVSVSATHASAYTIDTIETRFFQAISAGTTIQVSAGGTTYTFTAAHKIDSVDELQKEWNDSANWAGGTTLPPVGMVWEGQEGYRLFNRAASGSFTLTTTALGTESPLYLMGFAPLSGSVTISSNEASASPEVNALSLAWDINHAATAAGWDDFEAKTNGLGKVTISSTGTPGDDKSDFSMSGLDTAGLESVFPRSRNGEVKSVQDTIKDLLNKLEEAYRYNVTAWMEDGRIKLRDNIGGPSKLSATILPGDGYSGPQFGTFHVEKEGGGVDIFDMIKDLRDAMENNIGNRTVGMPSSWKGTALPMTTGQFRGNYNTTWTVEVDPLNPADVVTMHDYVAISAGGTYTSSVTLGNTYTLPSTISAGGTTYTAGTTLAEGTELSGPIHNTGSSPVELPIDIPFNDGDRAIPFYSNDHKPIQVTVKDARGKVVKRFVADQPDKDYYVRDGIYLKFSSGAIAVDDNTFTMQVGKGAEEEVGRANEASDQITRNRSRIGTWENRMKLAENRYSQFKLDQQNKLADTEEVDISEAVTKLQQAENAYRAALAAGTRLFNLSILDFI